MNTGTSPMTPEGIAFLRRCWAKVPPNVALGLAVWLKRKRGPIWVLTPETYAMYYNWTVQATLDRQNVIFRAYNGLRHHQRPKWPPEPDWSFMDQPFED